MGTTAEEHEYMLMTTMNTVMYNPTLFYLLQDVWQLPLIPAIGNHEELENE